MAGSPGFFARLWRLCAARNPLARPSDRAEGLLIMLAVLVSLTGIPIAAAVGSDTAAQGIQRSHTEMKSRQPSVARTLVATPDVAVSPGLMPGMPTTVEVDATWPDRYGAQRFGTIPVPLGTPTGADIPIWIDQAGEPTGAAFQPVDAIINAVGKGLITWFGISAPLTGTCWITHLALKRLRYAQWTRDWERFGRDSRYT